MGLSREQFEKDFAERAMLKRLPKQAEITNAAVLMAADQASAITAAVANLTRGELADQAQFFDLFLKRNVWKQIRSAPQRMSCFLS